MVCGMACISRFSPYCLFLAYYPHHYRDIAFVCSNILRKYGRMFDEFLIPSQINGRGYEFITIQRHTAALCRCFRYDFADSQQNRIATWYFPPLSKAKALKIPEINSFVEGVRRDFEAISNAVKFEYNNGLAEGKVIKLKLIKRIMYGRCRFSTLKNKVLLTKTRLFSTILAKNPFMIHRIYKRNITLPEFMSKKLMCYFYILFYKILISSI